MRSTQEWEKALEGTSEGRWEVGSNGTEVYHVDEMGRGITADTGSHIEKMWPDDDSGALDQAYADARLIALSREAVAEVVRLRKAIEDRIRLLRLPLCSHVPEGDELDDLAEQWNRQSYEAEVLTRILEGTHE